MAAWHPEQRGPAPRLPRAHRIALAGIGLLFAVGVASGLHGFSIGGWQAFLDDEPALAPLAGEVRKIRSDDWAVQVPLGLAQRAHDPPFPVVNTHLGRGQNALAPVQAPAAHPVALFRPALWGYFLGGDSGMAWMWGFELFGLVAVWSCVFAWAGRGRSGLACAAAVALAFAPFFQYWSLNLAPAAIFAGLGLLAAVHLASEARPRRILLAGALLGWSAGAFGLVLYPPAMVVLAQLGAVALFAGLAGAGDSLRLHAGVRALALALAAAVVGFAVWAFLDGAGDTLALVNQTAYPGHRTATGGDLPWWQLFSSNLWLAWWTDAFGPLRNICEAAGFVLFFPLIGAALALRRLRGGARPDALSLALLGYCVFLFAYQQWGFPEWLARATGLGFAPARRTQLGSGLADALLLVRFLSDPPGDAPTRVGSRGAAAGLAGAWAIFLAAVALQLTRSIPDLPLAPLLALVAANAVAAYAILAVRSPARVLSALALAAVVGTAWFNPLARGGADALRESDLATAILRIDAEHDGESVFVTYGSAKLANLVPALGVHGLNGTHTAPQLALWRTLDPLGRFEHSYNRYAHVEFAAGPGHAARFQLLRHDALRITLHPLARVLRDDLGVTHLLLRATAADRLRFERATGLVPEYARGRNAIYELPPLP